MPLDIEADHVAPFGQEAFGPTPQTAEQINTQRSHRLGYPVRAVQPHPGSDFLIALRLRNQAAYLDLAWCEPLIVTAHITAHMLPQALPKAHSTR